MRVRSSYLLAGLFIVAALLSAFIVQEVIRVRGTSGSVPFGPERLLDPGAGLAPARPVAPGEKGSVSGRVRTADGQISASMAVFARRAGGEKGDPARATVNDLGEYRLLLAEGDYRVWAAPPEAADTRAEPAFVRLERGQHLTVDLVAPSTVVGLTVVVLEPDGSPSAGAVVTMARPGENLLGLATPADKVGRLAVPKEMGLAGRPVEVHARNGGRTGLWTGTLPAEGAVTIHLSPASTIVGKLVATNRLTSGFVLTVASQPGRGAWRTESEQRFTGNAFAVPDLPPGRTRFTVRTDDGRLGSAVVDLAPGGTQKLDVMLEPR